MNALNALLEPRRKREKGSGLRTIGTVNADIPGHRLIDLHIAGDIVGDIETNTEADGRTGLRVMAVTVTERNRIDPPDGTIIPE